MLISVTKLTIKKQNGGYHSKPRFGLSSQFTFLYWVWPVAKQRRHKP